MMRHRAPRNRHVHGASCGATLPGEDPRRGRGPEPGAPNAGRPPNELRAPAREGLEVAIPRLIPVYTTATNQNERAVSQIAPRS